MTTAVVEDGGDEDRGPPVGLGDGEGGAVSASRPRRALGPHRRMVRSAAARPATSVSAADEHGRRRAPPRGASGPAAGACRTGRRAARRGRGWPTAAPAPRPGPAARGRGTPRSGRGPTRRAPRGRPRPSRFGPGQLRPQVVVEAVGAVLDLGHPFGRGHARRRCRRGRLRHGRPALR